MFRQPPQQGTFARGSQRPRSYDALLSLHGHDNFVSLGEGGNERIAEQHDYCVFGTQEADRDSDYCASCGNGKTCKASIHVFRGGGGTKRFVVQRTHAPHLDLHALMPSMIDKCKALRAKYPKLQIEIDGGLNLSTTELAQQSGADVVVGGWVILYADDMAGTIKKMR